MIKIINSLRLPPGLITREFFKTYLDEHVQLILAGQPGLKGFISNLVDEQELSPDYMGPGFHRSPYDLLISLHFENIEAYQPQRGAQGEWEKSGVVTDSYIVEEVEHWDNLPGRSVNIKSPGFKIIPFSCRKPGISKTDFNDHYRNVHSALARKHHPGIARYVQNFVLEKINSDAPDLDAIAELHFASFAEYRDGFYANTESPKIIGRDVVSQGDTSKMHYFKAVEWIHKQPFK
ncbi:EthD family reductase [bacterium]|nr:EthD family reductase [bacterium]